MKRRNPKQFDRLLSIAGRLVGDDIGESIVNHLLIRYDELKTRKGRFIADGYIWFQLFLILSTRLIETLTWRLIMLRNYLKTAFRNLRRNKAFSAINIAGLSIGLASCLLILIWVRTQLSYDRFNEHGDRIYRVIRGSSTDPTDPSVVTPLPLGPAMKRELPEVEAATRSMYYGRHLFRYEDKTWYERNSRVVDDDFFNIFSFPILRGNPDDLLTDPYSMVLSDRMAERFFGSENPVGKVLLMDNQYPMTVTGVVQTSGYKSHLRFDYLLSMKMTQVLEWEQEEWGNVSFILYIKLRENTNPAHVAEKAHEIIHRHEPHYSTVQRLQPVKEIYLRWVGGQIRAFSAIAAAILLIACINFVNLSTARSAFRTKEVSMRKVTGAVRTDLIRQFMSEAFLLTLIAGILGFLAAILGLPLLERLTGESFEMSQLLTWDMTGIFLGTLLVTGLLSGLYPALFFSRIPPIRAFREYSGKGTKGAGIRKKLIVVQFALSIILIVTTGMIARQLDYLQNKELGYKKDNIVYVDLKGGFKSSSEAVKQRLHSHPNIQDVSLIDRLPVMFGWGADSPIWEGKPENVRVQFTVRSVDADFDNTFDVAVAEGRFFSEAITTDQEAFILNQAAIKAMGMESPIGKWFEYPWLNRRGPIIGIVKDFHFASLHSEIEPLILLVKSDEYKYMCMRITSEGIRETLAFLEETWKEFAPQFPFEFRFLDESVQRLYEGERQLSALVRTFGIIAVFISCLGLLGLISFMIEQKTKEIGIRKVLGAPVSSVVLIFVRRIFLWMGSATLIAWPVAYYIINRWLQTYPYRIPPQWWIFTASGAVALAVALVTVGAQVIRAALANPVDSLRYE